MADDELALFVVADGMGGHAAGEVASRVAVESIAAFVRQSAGGDIAWPCDRDPSLSAAGNRIRAAIHLANETIVNLADNDDYAGMGTTVVCALITGGRVAVGHVGDSRLYSLSSRGLQQQTRDDTWANAVAANGGAATQSMRHVLTNVVGTRDLTEIHVSERPLVDGELLLLCTDGVHGVLDDETLRAVLSQEADIGAKARAVVAVALARGSRDNVTALLVEYMGDEHRV